MKNYECNINTATADNIINYLNNNNYGIDTLSGCLLDGFICEIGENNLRLGKIKMRKFIIVIEKALNEWSSTLRLILTDDESIYNKYYDIAMNELENS